MLYEYIGEQSNLIKLLKLNKPISNCYRYHHISNIYFHILVRSAVLHVNCFVHFSIYYMLDGSVACIASVTISLVTRKKKKKKKKDEFNSLMKKDSSYDNI